MRLNNPRRGDIFFFFFSSSFLINSQWSCGKSHVNSLLSLPAKTDGGKTHAPEILESLRAERAQREFVFFFLSTFVSVYTSVSPFLFLLVPTPPPLSRLASSGLNCSTVTLELLK